jgi:hypothetical protein
MPLLSYIFISLSDQQEQEWRGGNRRVNKKEEQKGKAKESICKENIEQRTEEKIESGSHITEIQSPKKRKNKPEKLVCHSPPSPSLHLLPSPL